MTRSSEVGAYSKWSAAVVPLPPYEPTPSFDPTPSFHLTARSRAAAAGGGWQGTTEQAPSPLFCSVLACSGAPTKPTRFVCSAAPHFFFGRQATAGPRQGGATCPRPGFLQGPVPQPAEGPEKNPENIRGRVQQNICSARRSEPRDLWPNAQPAPRLHRRTSFCLREQAVSTLYVPRRGSALCSTPAASWLPRSRRRPSRQRRCICSTY